MSNELQDAFKKSAKDELLLDNYNQELITKREIAELNIDKRFTDYLDLLYKKFIKKSKELVRSENDNEINKILRIRGELKEMLDNLLLFSNSLRLKKDNKKSSADKLTDFHKKMKEKFNGGL